MAIKMLHLPYPADSYRFVSEEVKETGFRIDGIFKPIDNNPELPHIFVEVQYYPDQDFYGRFFSEIVLYLYRNKPGHWLALVVYPKRATEKPAGKEFEIFFNSPRLMRLYLEDYQDLNDPDYGILRLIACRDNDALQRVRELLDLPETPGKDVIEFLETVLVYKLPTLSREEIRVMLGLNDVQLKKTRFYQEIAEEERLEGMQIGMKAGMQAGKQEGKQEGEVLFLKKLLTKRFGSLPDAVIAKLERADTAQLELWGERMLDAKALGEVFT